MKKSLVIFLTTILTFTIYFVLDDLFFNDLRRWLYSITGQLGISHIITYCISGIPLVLGIFYMHKPSKAIDSVGLNRPFLQGVFFALICTIPMLIGLAVFFDFSTELTLNTFLISVVSAAFFEELFFRGFLFGQLFRYTKLGFLPSVVIGAFLFAFVHFYQSDDIMTLVGIFSITFAGALLFAWAYTEWNFNIWVPIFLHFFMNLFWEMFSVSDNALGSLYANIFRIMAVVLIIIVTILYKKKKKQRLEINRDTLWLKNHMEA